MAKYGKKSQEDVKEAMHKYKRGELESGKSHKTVKNRKQAIAIGLSEARKEGAKVPKKKSASTTTASRTRKSAAKKTTSKKK